MKVFNNVIQANGGVINLSTNVNLKVSEMYEAFSVYNENYLTNCEITVENKTNVDYLEAFIIFKTTPTVACTIKYEDKMEVFDMTGEYVIRITATPHTGTVIEKININ